MRWRYLPLLYQMWKRILSPHTVMMLNCVAGLRETGRKWRISQLHLDEIKQDLMPLFDVLHAEVCDKNHLPKGATSSTAWCVYARLKSGEAPRSARPEKQRGQ